MLRVGLFVAAELPLFDGADIPAHVLRNWWPLIFLVLIIPFGLPGADLPEHVVACLFIRC